MPKWLLLIIQLVWAKVSPEIRESITKFVKQLEKDAAATPNPMDDFLVQVLKLLLGIT